jgi:hypothetical protein
MDSFLSDNKKLLVHICAEIVIVGGIVFWLHSKISTRDELIEKQAKEIASLKERLERIENWIRQVSGGQPAPPPPQEEHKKKKKNSPTTSKDEEEFKSSDDEEIVLG